MIYCLLASVSSISDVHWFLFRDVNWSEGVETVTFTFQLEGDDTLTVRYEDKVPFAGARSSVGYTAG